MKIVLNDGVTEKEIEQIKKMFGVIKRASKNLLICGSKTIDESAQDCFSEILKKDDNITNIWNTCSLKYRNDFKKFSLSLIDFGYNLDDFHRDCIGLGIFRKVLSKWSVDKPEIDLEKMTKGELEKNNFPLSVWEISKAGLLPQIDGITKLNKKW